MAKPIKKTDRKKAWAKRTMQSPRYPFENKIHKKKVFHIICEGLHTEPAYFKSFPLANATVKSFGLGQSKRQLMESVVAYQSGFSKLDDYEFWCVFDRDDNAHERVQQQKDIQAAYQVAKEHNIHIAYSSDSFELWFLLHYQLYQNQWTRHEYYEKLSKLWNCHYESQGKKLVFCQGIYRKLQQAAEASQEKAIQRAQKLAQNQINFPVYNRTPYTSVYLLVLELNKYL